MRLAFMRRRPFENQILDMGSSFKRPVREAQGPRAMSAGSRVHGSAAGLAAIGPGATATRMCDAMGANAAWWKGVDQASLSVIAGKIHPGALRYYKEAGFPLTPAQQ